jgi:hypothetical protein
MNSQNIIKAIQNGGNNPCPKSGEFEFGPAQFVQVNIKYLL